MRDPGMPAGHLAGGYGVSLNRDVLADVSFLTPFDVRTDCQERKELAASPIAWKLGSLKRTNLGAVDTGHIVDRANGLYGVGRWA